MQSHRTKVWTASPETLPKIDFSDPKSIYENTHLYDFDMTGSKWVQIGYAEVTYVELVPYKDAAAEMVANLDKAVTELLAETQEKVNHFKALRNSLLALEAPKS